MKILAPVAAILVVLFTTLSVYSSWLTTDEARLNLETKARSESLLAAHALARPIASSDIEQVKSVVEGVMEDPDVAAVAVYNADGIYLAGRGVDERSVGIPELLRDPITETAGHLTVALPVIDKSKDQASGRATVARIGAVWVDYSSKYGAERAGAARLRYIMIAVIGFGLTMLILIFVLSRLLEPIHRLTKATSEIVRGDLSQTIQVTSTDEIGQLATSFGHMVEKLREIPRRLQASTQMLLSSVDSLGRSTNEQSQNLTRQAAAVQETQVTVQEIKQTSLLAAQKAEAVLKVAERADEISRSGEVAISQSLGGLADIRAQVDEIAHKIGELEERTRQIGLITETVKDLADQSNMLALNAAIEAVRSGEHGKGFAVVAREIRNLADQSIQATVRVREILDDIGNAIRSAVSITERGAQKMEGGLIQMKTSGENLRELSAIVKDNAAAVRQIAAAVSQQNAGISQIFGAVSDLNQMMDETMARLEHTGKSVDALRGVSAQVSTVVTTFRV